MKNKKKRRRRPEKKSLFYLENEVQLQKVDKEGVGRISEDRDRRRGSSGEIWKARGRMQSEGARVWAMAHVKEIAVYVIVM